MSIAYSTIKKQIRTIQNDFNKVKYSDYDIKNAVNQTLRYMSKALAQQNTDFNEKMILVYPQQTVTSGSTTTTVDGYALPDDFLTLVSVMENRERGDDRMLRCVPSNTIPQYFEYKIVANRIYIACPEARMQYKASLGQISSDSDTIDLLPDTYLDDIVDIASMVLGKETLDAINGAVGNLVDALAPRRRYRNLKIPMGFKV